MPPLWTKEEVLQELDALAASKNFRRAAGLMSLLRFVVEAELRGDGADLKETFLGAAVYNREVDYDPKADGIVRVNANRLRARLNDHYRQFSSRLQIVLQPGSYRPTFVAEPAEPPTAPPPVIAVPTEPPPLPPRPRWIPWAVAAGLLLLVIPLWLTFARQKPWTQRSLSRMGGVQQFPDFSPDSRRLAYAVNDPANGFSALYVQGVNNDAPVKLSTRDRYESRPAWSPDGKRLAFIVRDPDHTVHVLLRPVTEDRETEIYAHRPSGPWLCDVPRVAWSHDGDEIITTAPPSLDEIAKRPNLSPGCGLVAINVATHAVRRLTYSPSGSQGDLEPAVSPDGKTIAFLRPVSYGTQDIYLVNVDGANEHRVLNIRDDIQGLAWMPDGKTLLLCARMGEPQLRILQLDPQTGKTKSIQTGAAPVAFAAISRDGHHIAFTEYHQQNKLLRVKDGRVQHVFNDGMLRQGPAFSPDASQLAYSSDRTGQNQLWVSDREGHGEHLVTANSSIKMTRPIWSADGRSLLFECRENGPSGICAIDLKTHRIVLLVRMQHDAILPSLSRDGTRLYFTSNDTGEYAGYRQSLRVSPEGILSAEGKPRQMTRGGTGFIHESPSGQMLYLLGPLPTLSLLAAPLRDAPISEAAIRNPPPAYLLRQQTSVDDCNSLTDEGLLSAEGNAGRYHMYIYRENSPALELETASVNEPIDSIAWDRRARAALLATRSTPSGSLTALSR